MLRVEGKAIHRRMKLLSVVMIPILLIVATFFNLSMVSGTETGYRPWDDVTSVTVSPVIESEVNWEPWHLRGCLSEPGVFEKENAEYQANLCSINSNSVAFTTYNPGGFDNFPYVGAKKQSDTLYHRIQALSEFENPTLLPQDRLIGMGSEGIYLLESIGDKLIPDIISSGPSSWRKVYALNRGGTNFFRDEANTVLWGRSFGASENGKYVAFHIFGRGIGVLNTDTMKGKLIDSYMANTPPQSESEYAILTASNDGKRVAVIGYGGVKHRVYTVDSECGETDVMNFYVPQIPCDYIDITDKLGPRVTGKKPYDIRFNASASQLDVTVRNTATSKSEHYTVQPSQGSLPKLYYLAMGDSYSSGEGDIERNPADKKYYRSGTNIDGNSTAPREKCHVSTRSYPYLIARSMGLALDVPKEWDTVACSGAISWDVTRQATKNYMGQKNGGEERLSAFTNTTNPNASELKARALNEFIPGRQKQIEFVRKYKPRAITLTMGGNDVGFGKKLYDCASPITTSPLCRHASTEGRASLAGQISNQYDNLKSLYEEIYSAAGGRARIYVVGYPQFISGDQGVSCSGIAGLNYEERKMIYNSVVYLNNVIEKAASAAGVKYIDIENSLNGHRICDSGEAYVNSIVGAPIAIKNESQESFHPNSKGHKAMYGAIRSGLNGYGLLSYPNYPGGPDVSATKSSIEVPEYFAGVLEKNSQYRQLTPEKTTNNSPFNVSTGDGAFKPSSSANVKIFSDEVDLGDYTVDSDGLLETQLTLPAGFPVGYHTLVVSGMNENNDPIEYEQVVLVEGPNPLDVDDNGVLDANQPCGPFMESSGIDANFNGVDDACDPNAGKEPELYRVRSGDTTRAYNGSPEQAHYLYIERNTRASSITGITGDDDPDGDGWAIIASSQGVPFTTTSAPDTGPAANFIVTGEGLSSKPYVYIRAGGYGCVAYTPTSLAAVEYGQQRILKRVALNTDNCRYDDPSDDLDFNGIADDEQPLYSARNGDESKGENPTRIYLFRSFHAAETQLGISDYSPTGTAAGNPDDLIQAWNLLAASKQNEYIPSFNKLVILNPDHPDNNTNTPLPIILTKKQNGQCIAYKPQYTGIIKMTTQYSRYLTKLNQVPEGEGCE